LGLPDPLVTDSDPDPDPSIIKQKELKTLDFYCFVTFYDFLSVKNCINVSSKSNKQKNVGKKVFVGIWKVTDEKSRIRIRIR
jgi:hypothetical protein